MLKSVKRSKAEKLLSEAAGDIGELSQEQMTAIFNELAWRLANLNDGYRDKDIIDVMFTFFMETDGSYQIFFDARKMKAEDFPKNLSAGFVRTCAAQRDSDCNYFSNQQIKDRARHARQHTRKGCRVASSH